LAEGPGIYQKKMDMRLPEEVESFCLFIKDLCRSELTLQAVISNAGVALGGPVENLPMSFYRDSFEINFFAAVRIIQALLPELIRSKGMIIVNGSNAGRIAMPFLSPYVSTKFALEGFCDSLRREVSPLGVRTVLLEPASVATPIWNKAKQQDVSFIDQKYLKSFIAGRDKFVASGNRGMDVKAAAVMIADILQMKKPKARYIISKNRLISSILQMLPSSVIDKAVPKIYKMDYGDQGD
jgi:short-subunit dehydrogenase